MKELDQHDEIKPPNTVISSRALAALLSEKIVVTGLRLKGAKGARQIVNA